MSHSTDLVAMMGRACPQPKDVVRSADADGAAAVALALHCASRVADSRRRRATVGFGTELLSSDEGPNNTHWIRGFFVEAGFQVEGGLLGWPWTWKKSYAPPSGWNERFQDEWVFEYTLAKTGSTFFLHCSTRNGKMYVRAIRANNLEGQPDINVLGLEISKYVSSKEEIAAATSWVAVLHNIDKLAEQAMQHLIQPFLVTEKKEPLASPDSNKWRDYLAIKASEWTDASVVLPVLSVGLVFAMGLGMSVYRRRISL